MGLFWGNFPAHPPPPLSTLVSRVHSLLDGARQTTNHFLNISFSPFPPKKKCTLEKEHSDENLEGASDVLKSPRNGSSYSRELTSANVRPPKSSSASKDSHRSELKVERHVYQNQTARRTVQARGN